MINKKSINNDNLFIIEGILGALVINLVNPFLSMYAKRLGANDFEIGLVSSMPALVGILALIPGALITDIQRDKKKITALMILISGIIYPFVIITPYLGKAKVIVYIIIISVVNWPMSVYNISWQSFFSDVYPMDKNRRNLVYTNRSSMSTLFGTIMLLATGLILTYIPKDTGQRIFIYQIFFSTTLLLSLIQSYTLAHIDGYPLKNKDRTTSMFGVFKSSLIRLRHTRQFCIFTAVVFYFYITWQMAWPLFFLFQVSFLHANEAWLSYLTIAANLAMIATFPFWRRIIEIKGTKWTAVIITACQALNPFLYIISPNLYILLLVNIFNGLTNSGFQLVLFDNMMEVIPQENKTINIAVYTTLLNISGLFSPILGVYLYQLTGMYAAMCIITISRFTGVALFYIQYRFNNRT